MVIEAKSKLKMLDMIVDSVSRQYECRANNGCHIHTYANMKNTARASLTLLKRAIETDYDDAQLTRVLVQAERTINDFTAWVGVLLTEPEYYDYEK